MDLGAKLCFMLGLVVGNWFCWWLLIPLLSQHRPTGFDCLKGLTIGVLAAIIYFPLSYIPDMFR